MPSGWGDQSISGEIVNQDTAMRHAAVYACVQKAANTIAQLPLQILEKKTTGSTISRDLAVNFSLYDVLHNRFHAGMTSFQARKMMQAILELRGNAVAQIMRNRGGEITEIYPWPPDKVQFETKGFNVRYWFLTDSGRQEIPGNQILHLKGLCLDGVLGQSTISAARDTIGGALAAQNYAARFFRNNAVPPGVLEFPPGTDPKDRAATVEGWKRGAGGENQHSVVGLPAGCKFSSIGISNEDSQFLETNKFSYRMICAIFDMIPHMVADLQDSSYNNMEQQGLEFVILTLMSRIKNLEQQYEAQLLTPEQRRRYEIRFNVDSLLRGDAASRWASHQVSWQMGARSRNEVREIEGLNPVEGGDTYMVMGNMVPLGPDGFPVQQQAQPAGQSGQNDQQQNQNQEPGNAGTPNQ